MTTAQVNRNGRRADWICPFCNEELAVEDPRRAGRRREWTCSECGEEVTVRAGRRRKSRTCPTASNGSRGKIVVLPISSIEAAPENEKLYAPIRATDPDVKALAASIREKGILEPLVISDDHFVLSGNRRLTAARLAGLKKVPCRIVAVRRDTDPDEFLRLLREYNRQRVKSRDEMLREEVVSVTPADAVRAVKEHRAAAAQVAVTGLDLGARRFRKSISYAKRPMLDAVARIIGARQEFWPLSDRQIHYALLNDPPLRHAGRQDTLYRNDRRSYQDLCDVLLRARLTGEISMSAIADETRPVTIWSVHKNVADYMRQELKEFLFGYYRDLQVGQPCHVELIVEKNTIHTIAEQVAADYCIPLTSGRGYCSLPPLAAMAKRFKDSGKEKFVLLILSDFDADGEGIAHALAHTLRDDFGIASIHPIKLALTAEQAHTMDLPPPMEAKRTSSRFKGFNDKHGAATYELEAVAPADLQNIIRAGIESVLDLPALAREREAEGQDQSFLAVERERVMRLLQCNENGEVSGSGTDGGEDQR